MLIETIQNGTDLKKVRENLGYSQYKMAEILNVSQCTISFWERSTSVTVRAKESIRENLSFLFKKEDKREISSKVFTITRQERPWMEIVNSGLFSSYLDLGFILHMGPAQGLEEMVRKEIQPEGYILRRLEVLKLGIRNEKEFISKLPKEMLEMVISFILTNEKTGDNVFRSSVHSIQRNLNRILIENNPRDIKEGDYFRRVRINFRMTQKEMAIVLELSLPDIAKFEKGEIVAPECVKMYRYLHNIWEKDDSEELNKISNWIITKRFDVLGDYLRDEA